jgi:nucleoside-diphosphate-sugar epimerase
LIRKINNAKNENKESVDIWGDGLARREFMYAGDFADFVFYAITQSNSPTIGMVSTETVFKMYLQMVYWWRISLCYRVSILFTENRIN